MARMIDDLAAKLFYVMGFDWSAVTYSKGLTAYLPGGLSAANTDLLTKAEGNKIGGGLFQPSDPQSSPAASSALVKQGYLEGSNVKVVVEKVNRAPVIIGIQ